MVQRPHGIHRWPTILLYKIIPTFIFLLVAIVAYSCTNQKKETQLATVMQQEEPLFGLVLVKQYETTYNKAGLDYIISEKLAKHLNSKTPIFLDLGKIQLGNISDVRISQLRVAESKDGAKLGNGQPRYLFIEKRSAKSFQITDTLKVNKNFDYSSDVTFENNAKGIAVGIFNQKEEFFEISALYEISKEGKKKKVDLKTVIIDCPVPTDYINDEDSGNYKFGIKNGKKQTRFSNDGNAAASVNQDRLYVLDSTQMILKDRILKILVLEKPDRKEENAQHSDLKITILQEGAKGFVTLYTNQKIVPQLDGNCPADGFMKIVSKDNYFTIEQTFCKDFTFAYSYATFKIVGDVILLHKYSESYTDRSNPDKIIKDKNLTSKDFGTIKFEDFDLDNFYKKIIQRHN